MPDSLSRRQVVRRAALLACLPVLGKVATGCARRIATNRSIAVAAPIDGDLRVPRAIAPELDQAGGAVVAHPEGTGRAYLVVNTGSGYVALQAECPHEGCELAWVPEDRQAECPCHGSRFAGDGTLLNPPARSDLSVYPAGLDVQRDVVVHLFAGDGMFKNPVVNGRFSFSLDEFPALRAIGGAISGRPDGFPTPLVISRLSANTDASAIAALSSQCTHLGCTVLPQACTPAVACAPSGTRLQCPCHGSSFALDGTATAGPATTKLLRYATEFDGSTVVVSTVPLG
jgi:cytochrome b6-f complex iron-sulfur subunit